MWILIALIVFNAIAGKSILFEFRIDVAGLPINVLDVLTVIGLVAAVFSNRREENERTHPLLIVSFVLFAAASLAGSIGGMQNGAIPRWVITPLRNLLALPLAAFIAYRIAYSGAR